MNTAKLLGVIVICLFLGASAGAQQQPQLQEEVVVRWWLVPVYAVDGVGAPIKDLAADDLEVSINNIKVEKFDLHRKEFRLSETKKGTAPDAAPQPPPQRKMVFLVFDVLSSTFDVMERAKAIAEKMLAESDKSSQFILLSIDPMQGLRHIYGPTSDLQAVRLSMKKSIKGRKLENQLSSSLDSNAIRNVSPGGLFHPEHGGVPFSRGDPGAMALVSIMRRNDWRNKRRLATIYMSALITLNLALGDFRDYSKVIYLYSCGIPNEAFENRQEIARDPVGIGPPEWTEYAFADTLAFEGLRTIGRNFNHNGAILFPINPAGNRAWQNDPDSGELSLRTLAGESGGRYFEGADQQIADQVNSMEGGYYEISFPDKPEYEGQEMSFGIRSRRPEVTIFTLRNVGREKSYVDMTDLEKEVLVLNILSQGRDALSGQKVVYVEGRSAQDGEALVCRLTLPKDIARTEWTAYRVARNFATGAVYMDKDVVIPTSPNVEVRMKWRGKEFRHDIVLANLKTGTILVWK